MANSTSQQRLQNAYSSFSQIFTDAKDKIDSLSTRNKNFVPIQETFKKQLGDIINMIRAQLEDVERHAVWDKLVIAFIGVTNAGKSTIIETFRILFDEPERKAALAACPSGVDGEIIGDGRADFTRVYKEYDMRIGNKDFVLIDVPGIEGNEKAVKQEILKALSKAHCVFYVQGEGKKPDTATVTKIKDYLKDWVKVYAIYNVKGTAFNYDDEEERAKFMTDSIVKVEKEIDDTMRKALGDNYAGCITLQARLALCARAQFAASQQALKQEQQELLMCFGNGNAMLSFSNFDAIITHVDHLAKHFADEILDAQRKKLYKLHVESFKAIDAVQKSQTETIDRMIAKFKTCKRNVDNYFSSARYGISSQMRGEITSMFSTIEQKGCQYIDDGKDKDELKKLLGQDQEQLSRNLKAKTKSIVENELADLQKDITQEISRLRESFAAENMSMNFSADFNLDLSDVIKELDFNNEDFMNVAGAIIAYIGAVWALVVATNWWNPVAWIVGLGLALWRIFGPSKKERAKKQFRKAVYKASKDFFSTKWHEIDAEVEKKIGKKAASFDRKIQGIIDDFKAIKEQMNSVTGSIKRNASKYK